ncbi:sufE-like protein 1, chloroplastic/mitochondrial [Oryza glaberrima]|uniref:sufE-like protein 1, chloroplastic/mitochondrial n=1 Tax=Oryza glaberrima TaxID=4538 RepID=UPI00224BF2B3|nr:sufE-like protein 1, chloroplastic/mitochondrial [Oryza glaberrima]
MDPALKTDANCIRGCVSQVWVHAAPKEGAPDRVSFQADSDAQLTKGLAALLVLGLFDAPARDVAMVPVEFIELLGIRQSLSPSRNSGLLNMISLMKHKVLEITIGEVTTEEIGRQDVVQEVAEPPAAVTVPMPSRAAAAIPVPSRAGEPSCAGATHHWQWRGVRDIGRDEIGSNAILVKTLKNH